MPGPDDRDADWQTTVNLLAVIAVLGLLLAGLWLVMELDKAKKAQDCLSSSLRRCRQIDARESGLRVATPTWHRDDPIALIGDA